MRMIFATIIALVKGKATIKSVKKTVVSRTPGDVTVGGHQ
jgi:hypothetical protein